MVRVRQFALASIATLAVTGTFATRSMAADEQPGMTAPSANQTVAEVPAAASAAASNSPLSIQVPVGERVVGAPTKDVSPPAQAASQSTSVAPSVPPAAEAVAVPALNTSTEPAKAEAVQSAPAASTTEAATVPSVPPAFALATELSERLARDKSGAREDRDAAQKFYEARQGAPLWVVAGGLTPAARKLIAELGKAGDYGLPADAFAVPASVAAAAERGTLADAEATLTLSALKYARFARGGRMDPAALSRAIDRKAQVLPASKVLDMLATTDRPGATLRDLHPRNPQFEKLRLKYVALKAGQPVVETPPDAVASEGSKGRKAAGMPVAKAMTPNALERKLLANMEMWRWMPDMGTTYIQPNIPEFTVSVVRDGKLVHKERIVTGKPDTMTPMFSDSMRLVVFKPFWNVPESIKYKELQPGLLRGSPLERAGLRAEINGRVVDSASVNWAEVDMRNVHIFQPPGEANALGRVKFLFPNKHDVYLHDTPSKSLFAQSVRAYSHGCMRVRDPLKLAEVILSADKGWTRAQVDKQAMSGPDNTEIKLTTPVPVHITYFTAWVDDEDKLQTVADIYGHEGRIQLGLEGKAHLIAQQREERFTPPSAQERRRFAEQRQKKSDPVGDWVKNVFNF